MEFTCLCWCFPMYICNATEPSIFQTNCVSYLVPSFIYVLLLFFFPLFQPFSGFSPISICFNSSYMPNYSNCRRLLTKKSGHNTATDLFLFVIPIYVFNSYVGCVCVCACCFSLSLSPIQSLHLPMSLCFLFNFSIRNRNYCFWPYFSGLQTKKRVTPVLHTLGLSISSQPNKQPNKGHRIGCYSK